MAGTSVRRPGQPSASGGAVTRTASAPVSASIMAPDSATDRGVTPSAVSRAASSGRRKVAAIAHPCGLSRRARAAAEKP